MTIKDVIPVVSTALLTSIFAMGSWIAIEFVKVRDEVLEIKSSQSHLVTSSGEIRPSHLVMIEIQRNDEQDRRLESLEQQCK